MLRCRVTSERQPRTKNGAPAHSTTGVDSASEIQFDHAGGTRCIRPKWPPISITNTGSGQHQRDPEPPRHVGEFGIRRLVERNLFRLQRHAADRTTARPDLPHLGMHRAGVDRAGGAPLRRGCPAAFGCRNFSGSASNRSRQRAGKRNNPAPDTRTDAWRSRARPSCRRPDRSRPRQPDWLRPRCLPPQPSRPPARMIAAAVMMVVAMAGRCGRCA